MSAATIERPALPRTQVEPAPAALHYVKPQEEVLWDYLQRAEHVACLLFMNYGGDGAFEEADDAPGVKGMCALVDHQLQAAEKLAAELGIKHSAITHAAALAQHMTARSVEELASGAHGFRLGDGLVGMAYWTIETLAHQAYEDLSGASA